MEISDRIKKIRRESSYGKTQDMFAEYLGISKQNVSSYEVGRRNPSDAAIKLICEKCQVNEEWLRTGTGDPYKEVDKDFGAICAEIGANDENAKAALLKYAELTPEDKKLFWDFVEKFLK